MSYLGKLISQNGRLIHKVIARDYTGRWAYYFIFIPESKESAFMRALAHSDNVEFDAYGTVVASCYGVAPNKRVRQQLYEEYGFILS